MGDNKYELVKFVDDELELEVSVSPKEETVWMSQAQLSFLFGVKENVINYHIKDIFKKQELVEDETTRKFRVVRIEGSRKVTRQIIYYNLDMIISIGYRVNSKRGIIFRKWANKILKEYLLKGYVINENRVTVSNENYIELKNEVTLCKEQMNYLAILKHCCTKDRYLSLPYTLLTFVAAIQTLTALKISSRYLVILSRGMI